MNGVISQAGADRSVRLPFQLKQIPVLREDGILGAAASCCLPVQDPFGRSIPMALSETLNQLAAKGVEGSCLSVRALFPADTPEGKVRALFEEVAAFCLRWQLAIASPEASYIPQLSSPVLGITAYGEPFEKARGVLPRAHFHIRVADPGTQVVMAGYAGWAGTAILAGRYREDLWARFPQRLVADACGFEGDVLCIRAARIGAGFKPQCMIPVGEGGVFRALWLLGQEMNAGFVLDLKAIPLRQETVEICEWLQENPYQLYGNGALLLVTEEGEALVDALLDEGIEAAVLGRMTNRPARVLKNGEDLRYLEKPQPDMLWRLMQEGEEE